MDYWLNIWMIYILDVPLEKYSQISFVYTLTSMIYYDSFFINCSVTGTGITWGNWVSALGDYILSCSAKISESWCWVSIYYDIGLPEDL